MMLIIRGLVLPCLYRLCMRKHPYLLLLGKRIKELRQISGHSQEAFAGECGLDRSYYGGVERGERNIAVLNLIKIAAVLGVEIGELVPSIKSFRRIKLIR